MTGGVVRAGGYRPPHALDVQAQRQSSPLLFRSRVDQRRDEVLRGQTNAGALVMLLGKPLGDLRQALVNVHDK